MNRPNASPPPDPELLELFRVEAETHARVLESGLVALEGDASPARVEPLMRAAHSLKGAARIVGLPAVVELAHVMEDVLVAVGQGGVPPPVGQIDALLQATDLFTAMAGLAATDLTGWLAGESGRIAERVAAVRAAGVAVPAQPAEQPSRPAVADSPGPPEVPPLDPELLELFRVEAETHARVLESGLVALEGDASPARVEPLMRAAHSLKGAARIVGLPAVVELAHVMEDVLVAVGQGGVPPPAGRIDALLQATDLFTAMAGLAATDLPGWLAGESGRIAERAAAVRAAGVAVPAQPAERPSRPEPAPSVLPPDRAVGAQRESPSDGRQPAVPPTSGGDGAAGGFVRIRADSLSRLLGLSGECLVQSRGGTPLRDDLRRMKLVHLELEAALQELGSCSGAAATVERAAGLADQLRRDLETHRVTFDLFARRLESLTERMYGEVVASRMRPFAEGVHGFPRMVRDLARALGKRVELVILGGDTPVDRDVLERLEAPLTHLLRNAVDHGLEGPEDRLAAGKDPLGRLTLEARHQSGVLGVTVRDDGRGVNLENVRNRIRQRDLAPDDVVVGLGAAELLEFLFLPGFSTAGSVTEFSGRGVGLDVVQSMVGQIGGGVRIEMQPGRGTAFHLQLPLTLSVVRALLFESGGEPWALPLSRVDRLLRVPPTDVQSVEGRQFADVAGDLLGLMDARQVLRLPAGPPPPGPLPVVVLSDRHDRFGLVVERFLGHRELVVIPLDPRLGRIPTVSAGAILEDGAPVLILDPDDLVRTMDRVLTDGRPGRVIGRQGDAPARRKRVLVVEDSLTVREIERKLLENRGYEVSTAVDGADGWSRLQTDRFDLVVTDVDMPRMNGIELVRRMREEDRLRALPVVIVSYKDREEDRLRGLEVGANHYLTKGSFHDDRLLEVVRDLIGEA